MRRDPSPVESVLFIHEVSYKTKPIFEMHEFPEILALRGIKVSFLHFEESARIWKGWTRKPTEFIKGRVIHQSQIRLLTPFQLGIPGLDRLIASISIPLRLIREIRTNRPDIVVSYAFPTGGIGALIVCKVLKVPHLQRVIDYSPGLRPFPLSIVLEIVDRIVFRFGRDFSTHNHNLLGRIAKLSKSSTTKIYLNVPPVATPSKVSSLKSKKVECFIENTKGKKINLVFLGTLYRFSGIVEVVEVMQSSTELAKLDVALHIFGLGPDEERLQRIIRESQNPGLAHFYGFLDWENIYAVFSKCDVGLVPFLDTKVGQYALPNKALQYLAAGLPVISTPLLGLNSTVNPQVIFRISNLSELPTLIAEISANRNRLKVAKVAAEREAKKFGYEVSADSFLATLEQVLDSA